MLTEAQKEKIGQKIAQLKKAREEAEARLASERSFNISAWNEYGSELCAGEMIKNERELERAIRALSGDIDLLQQGLDGAVDPEPNLADVAQLDENARSVKRLQDESDDVQKRIATSERLKRLMDG